MELINANKIYKMKNSNVYALNDLNLKIDESKGGFYAIMGHSGSGKSTLIQILGLLDKLTTGSYVFDGKNVSVLSEKEKAFLRMKKIGFIFQSFYLDPNLKAYENVMLPMLINKEISSSMRKQRAIDLLMKFNLSDRIFHYPSELSGGEQQRVAIARALANEPDIILADEPTGNLDIKNEKLVFNYLKELSKNGKCVIVVSHNLLIKEYADYIYYMNEGRIVVSENEN